MLDAGVCARALGARDARFDGLFFVGITSTRIYCRPVCPARVSYPDRRRFFESAAAAESAGFRPCLRCRPELAPGRALVDAVPRLAHVAAHRIAAGALNEGSVAELATNLGVSERHLRRALEREVGVSPLELAQTHRLLLAKRLLVDTALPVTHIAYASGFQSLRRFNAAFHERYRMGPSALRHGHTGHVSGPATAAAADHVPAPLRLTLAYREPMAWDTLLAVLRRNALPGVEVVDAGSYGRTVRLGERIGTVFVHRNLSRSGRLPPPCLTVDLSPALLPAVMPLLARLRRLFDLDAEPTVIDAHLAQSGLGALVADHPGLRIPGAFDGFEIALALLVRSGSRSDAAARATMRRLVEASGVPIETGYPALTRLTPSAASVAEAGVSKLAMAGLTERVASAIVRLATMIAEGSLHLEPGSDVNATHRALVSIDSVTGVTAAAIIARALQWPDAFAASDRLLRLAAGARSISDLVARAEAWRPWRAYAAMHLRLSRRHGEYRRTELHR
jgi:AraC family transcriptional regulator, regulatory protein of adaptative response / DNA-3-methyladenine glycosylase II